MFEVFVIDRMSFIIRLWIRNFLYCMGCKRDIKVIKYF